MNILLWLAYKGTNYSGFQVQPNGVTVCAVVQDAMQSVFGTRPDVKGCSRTDAGVHARRFALNFHYDGRIPVQRIPLALNARLPMDVRALAAQQVPDDFHARYAAHAKTYHYRLRCSAVDDPFDYETCHRVNGPLDLAAMQVAAAHFVGRHDFLALCALPRKLLTADDSFSLTLWMRITFPFFAFSLIFLFTLYRICKNAVFVKPLQLISGNIPVFICAYAYTSSLM